MPIRSLKKNFSKKMLPLCIAVFLIVSIIPPVSYVLISKKQLGVQAEIYARLLAHDIGRAGNKAYLWQYRTNKILLYTKKHQFQRDIAAVTIRDCSGKSILDSTELGIGTGSMHGPRFTTWIQHGGKKLGSVEVILDASTHRDIVRLLAFASILLGLALGGTLYFLPVRVVEKQANELELAHGKLKLQHLLEEERKRIARDLHDGVGQALTALQIELNLVANGEKKHAVEAGHLAEEVLDEIRSAVMALRPLALNETSIEDALRNLLERFELRTGIHSSIRFPSTLSLLNDSLSQIVYRIIQEALTNTARHAQAKEVGIVLEVIDTDLLIGITDDGIGFDVDSTNTSGLSGIRERVEICNGTMNITSTADEGVTIQCRIPLAEEKRSE